MTKKRYLFLVIVLLIIVIIIFIFRPIPFDEVFFNTDKMSVLYLVNSMKDGTIYPDSKVLTFESNSAKFHQIKNIFEKYSYHKCFKTWINNEISHDVGTIYRIFANGSTILITENSYIEIDSNIYRVGYLGNFKAKKLITELKEILENWTIIFMF